MAPKEPQTQVMTFSEHQLPMNTNHQKSLDLLPLHKHVNHHLTYNILCGKIFVTELWLLFTIMYCTWFPRFNVCESVQTISNIHKFHTDSYYAIQYCIVLY